jgi:predicted dehydrogenase
VLGDEIEAQFAFAKGAMATFTSRAKNRETAGHWGMELIGSKGIVRILADINPRVFVRSPVAWSDAGAKVEWSPMPLENRGKEDTAEANGRMVDDLLRAIETDGQPACNGAAAAGAIEMVMAVYQAGLSGRRAEFPLKDRKHPLTQA